MLYYITYITYYSYILVISAYLIGICLCQYILILTYNNIIIMSNLNCFICKVYTLIIDNMLLHYYIITYVTSVILYMI